MKNSTHIVVSVGVGLFLLSFFSLIIPLGFLFFFFGVLFTALGHACDWLDFRIFKVHERNFWTHSPLSPLLILIAVIIGALTSFLNLLLGIYIGWIVYVIFFLHFFLDALNPSGVPLMPHSRIRFYHIPFNDFKANFTFFIAGLFLIILGLFIFSFSNSCK